MKRMFIILALAICGASLCAPPCGAQIITNFIVCRDTTSTGAGLNACAYPPSCLSGGSNYPCPPPIASVAALSYIDTTVVDGTTYYYQVAAVGPGGTSSAPSASITAVSGSSGTLTFSVTTPASMAPSGTLAVGQGLLLNGFSTDTALNGQVTTVLSSGLSSSQFEAAVTGSGYSNDTGTAVSEVTATIPGTGTHSVTLSWNDSGVISPAAALRPRELIFLPGVR